MKKRKIVKSKEDIKAFLKDLGDVYKKHGIIVDSCGCCPPFIEALSNMDPYYGEGIQTVAYHIKVLLDRVETGDVIYER